MSTTPKPTPEIVRAFWEHMRRRYHTQIVDKASAHEMRLAGWFLQRIGVLDAERFLAKYTTTVGTRVYTPFEIGVSMRGHDLWSQLVTCVHEHQHVVQLRENRPWFFVARYLGSRAARAAYEAEAYTCNMELHFWRTGKIRSPASLANRLADYGCRPADVEAARQTLLAAGRAIRAGAIITPTARVAIAWLEEHAPELKHQPVSPTEGP